MQIIIHAKKLNYILFPIRYLFKFVISKILINKKFKITHKTLNKLNKNGTEIFF